MQTLIICVDRDNDLGHKAGIISPIIGRAENIEAATKLAIKDPEDSDLNTIFGGIRVYDKLHSDGVDVEIVSIAGDQKVGFVSDQKIAKQLDYILEKYKAEGAIVVSDGAEDEAILPIIQSRIKIDAVERVVVKQHENLESTYYIIKQAFNDPKISHTFFVPLGLAFLIYAISLYIGYPQGAIIAITAAIGGYMLFRGTGLDDLLNDFKKTMIRSLHGAKITFIMYLVAIILAVIGTVQGATGFWEYYNQDIWQGYLILLMGYINTSIWWYVLAGLFMSFGSIIDLRLEKKNIGRIWAHPFFVFASGLLLWGWSTYILVSKSSIIGYPILKNGSQFLSLIIVFAIIVSLVGIWLSMRAPETKTA